ncbi:MAG: response regulator [Lachnospiraceae bacterium]|nr:response regulator [Lachnospiraceae bacterium]
MKNKKRSTTSQVLITVLLFIFLSDIFLGLALTDQAKKAVKELINDRMLGISNTAASMLDGDVLKEITKEDAGSAAYETEINKLKAFQKNTELEYIYCIKKTGENDYVFSIDPTENGIDQIGNPVVVTDAMVKASQGIPSVDSQSYEDAWGRFYGAYSPVYDSKGELAAIVGVDFGAQWYESQSYRFEKTIMTYILITLLFGVIVAIVIMKKVRKYYEKLDNELYDLAINVDYIANEVAASTGITIEDDPQRSSSLTVESITEDEIQEIYKKINMVKDHLQEYVNQSQRQTNSMITALSADYWSVYYVDLDNDKGICYRSHSKLESGLEEGEHFCFSETFRLYSEKYVTENYRNDFLSFIDPDNIRKKLETEPIIAFRYLSSKNGKESYEMLRMAGVRRVEDRDDHIVHSIGVGFTDVDAEMRNSLDQSQALSDALIVAEEASKAKTAFLSNMSHEIRTPMNAIIALNNIILENEDINDKTREYLEQIKSSADHLLKLINDILDMSRIESGKISIKNDEFSISELIAQINTIINGQCQDNGIHYTCKKTGSLDYYLMGDDTKIKQVLINILGNAVKFTPSGGDVTFAIERTAHFDNKSTMQFTISDTGIGMDEEYLPKLFDAFSQEDSSSTNKYGSTGLGMAITQNIVDMMNGTIRVKSKKGEGTTFVVSITLVDAVHEESEEVKEEKTRKQAMTDVSLEGKRVLLAEDIAVNARIMLELLKMKKILADHAENGKIAVEMFEQSEQGYYDVILMDMRMPEMDGLTATTTIRNLQREDAKKIPIIALTANAFEEDVQRSLQAGLNAHLSKPIDAKLLFETMSELIRQDQE